MKNTSEAQKFDRMVRKILSISREELKRREAEWKRQHAGRKAGRKPSKKAASSRASSA
jgi:hypothetical protein